MRRSPPADRVSRPRPARGSAHAPPGRDESALLMTPAELVARGESKEVCGILPPSGFGSYHRRNLPELRDECGSRAELIFEPRQCRAIGVAVRVEGRSSEARAE